MFILAHSLGAFHLWLFGTTGFWPVMISACGEWTQWPEKRGRIEGERRKKDQDLKPSYDQKISKSTLPLKSSTFQWWHGLGTKALTYKLYKRKRIPSLFKVGWGGESKNFEIWPECWVLINNVFSSREIILPKTNWRREIHTSAS